MIGNVIIPFLHLHIHWSTTSPPIMKNFIAVINPFSSYNVSCHHSLNILFISLVDEMNGALIITFFVLCIFLLLCLFISTIYIYPMVGQLNTMLASDPVFEIFCITCLPQSSHTVHNICSAVAIAVVKNKALRQAPLPWCHNAIPRWCHIQNITGFWNLELDTLSMQYDALDLPIIIIWTDDFIWYWYGLTLWQVSEISWNIVFCESISAIINLYARDVCGSSQL